MDKGFRIVAVLFIVIFMMYLTSCKETHIHNWSEWENKFDTSTGIIVSKNRHCIGCDELETEEVVCIEHVFGEAELTKPAACEEEGIKTFKCLVCNFCKSENIPAREHRYEVVIKDSTCDKTGSKKTFCVYCRIKETIDIEKKPHTYIEGICENCEAVDPNYVEINYSQGLEYELIDDGKHYSVLGIGECTDKDIIIPKIYNGLPVTEITELAFGNNKQIESVVISNTIKKIGISSFVSCPNLKKVQIASSVTHIAVGGFNSCPNLEEVIFEENSKLSGISENLFMFCPNLKSIIIPEGVKGIGDAAFLNCTGLEKIYIPGSVVKIGEIALFGCVSLKEVEFGENSQLLMIEERSFGFCESLISIELPSALKVIGNNAFLKCKSLEEVGFGEDSMLTTIQECAFINCESLKTIELPGKLITIEVQAFENCKSLEKAIIPKSVTNIGYIAFRHCDSLTIYCESESKPKNWRENWNSSNRPVIWGYVIE